MPERLSVAKHMCNALWHHFVNTKAHGRNLAHRHIPIPALRPTLPRITCTLCGTCGHGRGSDGLRPYASLLNG
jgi:hypothetical protein